MEIKVNLHASYSPSEYIVARKIEGELIIVPLVSGIGDMEDELYTLNVTRACYLGQTRKMGQNY